MAMGFGLVLSLDGIGREVARGVLISVLSGVVGEGYVVSCMCVCSVLRGFCSIDCYYKLRDRR